LTLVAPLASPKNRKYPEFLESLERSRRGNSSCRLRIVLVHHCPSCLGVLVVNSEPFASLAVHSSVLSVLSVLQRCKIIAFAKMLSLSFLFRAFRGFVANPGSVAAPRGRARVHPEPRRQVSASAAFDFWPACL
jgi:hypothetical protein